MSKVTFRRPDGRYGSYADWAGQIAAQWEALSDADKAESRARAAARFTAKIKAAQAEDEATLMYVYDEIGWFGICPADVVEALAAITGDVEVHVNSPGGSVFDGLAIYAALKQHAGQVSVVVDGLAASAASFIAMAASPGKLAMTPNGTMMIHDAWGLCVGDSAEMAAMAALLDKSSDNIASIYGERAGKPAAGFRALMKDETWAVGQEAVDHGLADTVLTNAPPPDPDAPDPTASLRQWQVTISAAAAAHAPFSGTHSHPHTAGGDQGDDATHEHDHTHDGDADHGHDHGDPSGRAPAQPAAAAGDCCPMCGPDCECAQGDGPPADCGRSGRILGIESMPLAEALPVHHTATVDEAWDGPAAVKAMPNDAKVLKYCHAWQDSASDDGSTADDPDGDADDVKANYKFPHHKTQGGPANVRACNNGLSRLSGADIPDSDRAGVKAHLRAHLEDAGQGDDDSNHAPHHLDLSRIDLGDLGAALKGAIG